MDKDSLLSRRRQRFTALKERGQKIAQAFKEKLKTGSQQHEPVQATTSYNAVVSGDQGALASLRTPIQTKGGERAVVEDAGEKAVVDVIVRNETTEDAGTTLDNTQAEDTPSHAVTLGSPCSSELAPIWGDALNDLSKKHPKAYQALNEAAHGALEDPGKAPGALYSIMGKQEAPSNRRARWKKYLPTFSALKGISMVLARNDPHGIAPLVCASVFFSIEVALNNMNEDAQERISKILLSCDDMIIEYVSFERYFTRKGHPAIREYIPQVEAEVRGQYKEILLLVSEIHELSNKAGKHPNSVAKQVEEGLQNRVDRMVAALTQRIQRWETQEKKIKEQHFNWQKKRKQLDSLLSEVKETKEVRDWIKKDNDPEPELDEIEDKVTTEGQYKDAAKWFQNLSDYCSWRDSFLDRAENNNNAKHVLWLNGTSGTGKTTIMFQAYSALSQEVRTNLRDGVAQVVPYFCYASGSSQRADCETIIRALIWHLSLLPDATLAPQMGTEYNLAQNRKSLSLSVRSWKNLFLSLIGSRECDRLVFVVDALDECLTNADGDEFLRFMANEVMTRFPNVYLLVSSQKHVPVEEVFPASVLYKIEVNSTATKNDMINFIDGEIERRRVYSTGSIFYNDDCTSNEDNLLERLRSGLREHCQGMFRWVQIWLDICLPLITPHIVHARKIAEGHLAQLKKDGTSDITPYNLLEKAYQRLWDFNCPPDPQEQKTRDTLFHIALASFQNLSIGTLLDALAIAEEESEQNIQMGRLLQLCSGFLDHRNPHYYRPGVIYLRPGVTVHRYFHELYWVHASARAFVSEMPVKQSMQRVETEGGSDLEFNERSSHSIIADIFLKVVGNWNHRLWTCEWTHKTDHHCTPDRFIVRANDCRARDWILSLERPNSLYTSYNDLLDYLIKWGWQHCRLAARQASIFDPLWNEVLNQVLISPMSAFIIMVLRQDTDWARHHPFFLQPHPESGELRILFSHVIAWLNIIHEDDIPKLFSPTADPQIRQHFESSAHVGGLLTIELQKETRALLDENVTDTYYCASALELAVLERNEAAVELILQIRKPKGKSSGYYSQESPYVEMDSKVLWLAAAMKMYAIVTLLLEKSEANADSLWQQVKEPANRSNITRALRVFETSQPSETLLTWAEKNQDDRLLQILMDHSRALIAEANAAQVETMQRRVFRFLFLLFGCICLYVLSN